MNARAANRGKKQSNKTARTAERASTKPGNPVTHVPLLARAPDFSDRILC
jgi:hypothetical protein